MELLTKYGITLHRRFHPMLTDYHYEVKKDGILIHVTGRNEDPLMVEREAELWAIDFIKKTQRHEY